MITWTRRNLLTNHEPRHPQASHFSPRATRGRWSVAKLACRASVVFGTLVRLIHCAFDRTLALSTSGSRHSAMARDGVYLVESREVVAYPQV